MLLTRLQSQRESGFSVEIGRTSDDTSRHLPDDFFLTGHDADPYGDGWIVRLQPSGDAGDAMEPDAYQAFLDELDE